MISKRNTTQKKAAWNLWRDLQAQFSRSSRAPQAVREFAALKGSIPQLAPFADATALVEHLNATTGDLDEKDSVYGALVKVVQARGPGASTASTLLWLGLWPVLTGLLRSQLDEHSEPDELISEISEWFTTAIARADLSRITRIAATLARNTERNLAEQHQRDQKASQHLVYEPDLASLAHAVVPAGSGLSEAAELEAVHDWVKSVVGEEDADLVVGVAVVGEAIADMGERLGISPELARQRYRRAIAKLRSDLTE